MLLFICFSLLQMLQNILLLKLLQSLVLLVYYNNMIILIPIRLKIMKLL